MCQEYIQHKDVNRNDWTHGRNVTYVLTPCHIRTKFDLADKGGVGIGHWSQAPHGANGDADGVLGYD